MKFFLSSFLFAILAFVSIVSAAPAIQLSKRDVFIPPVLTPGGNDVWKVGSTQTVTWDVSNPPKSITNTEARVYLVTDSLIDFDSPLALGVNVLDGETKVTVPNVSPGSDYQILVFGDSGNMGEFFTIEQ